MERLTPILELKESHHGGSAYFYRYNLDKNKIWFMQENYDGHIYAVGVVERPEMKGVRFKVFCGTETPMYPQSISYDKTSLDKTQLKYAELLAPAIMSIFELPEHAEKRIKGD